MIKGNNGHTGQALIMVLILLGLGSLPGRHQNNFDVLGADVEAK